jgi:hypothetical protein
MRGMVETDGSGVCPAGGFLAATVSGDISALASADFDGTAAPCVSVAIGSVIAAI